MTTRYLRPAIDPNHQYRRWIDPRVRTLRLADVTAYLAAHGWQELPPDREHMLAFHEPTKRMVNGSPVCQFVPDSEAYDIYPLLMFELITGLAEFEDWPAAAVIDDILHQTPPSKPNGCAPERSQGVEIQGEGLRS